MLKKYHFQLTIAFLLIVLLGVSYETFRSGMNKVRIYQIIMLGYLLYLLINSIIDFIKNKKNSHNTTA
jgi:hypothetical protein